MLTNKKDIVQKLESNDLEAVAGLVQKDRKVLSLLVRMSYDKETLVGWRAIKTIGLAATELVKSDPGFLRETIRKLLWSLSDESGGIGWSAPEILGEIVSADPILFQDIIPIIAEVYEIEETVFRPGVVYALSKVAEKNPSLVMPHKEVIIRALFDENPLVRIQGIEGTNYIKRLLVGEDKELVRKHLEKLLSDRSEVWIYGQTGFENVQIKELAMKVIKLLD